MKNPKVFISHATEDKERFVNDFYYNLREKGIDAWMDKWEIKYGDSIVTKIFEEGIGECDAFLIVISRTSVKKKWVKEELNSAVIRRIEENIRLIPVVIDPDVKIPPSINALYRVVVKDLNNYDKELDDLISLLHGYDKKPALNNIPKLIDELTTIPGLSHEDSAVLMTIGDIVVDKESEYIEYNDLKIKLSELGLSEDQLKDSLEILDSDYYLIKIEYVLGGIENSPIHLKINGFWEYFNNTYDSEEIFKSICSIIVNEDIYSDFEIQSKLGYKNIIIHYVLKYLDMMGYIELDPGHMGGLIRVDEVPAKGKRYFRQLLS